MKAGPPCQRVIAELGIEEDDPDYVRVFKLLVDLWDDGYNTGDEEGYDRGYWEGEHHGYDQGWEAGYPVGLEDAR